MDSSASKTLFCRAFSHSDHTQSNKITIITNTGFFTGKVKPNTQNQLDLTTEHFSVQQLDDMQMSQTDYIELEDVVFNPNFMPNIKLTMPSAVLFTDQILGFVFGEVKQTSF